MPAEFKSGTATSYDASAMQGTYNEVGGTGGTGLPFEISRPNVNVVPGDSIEVLYKTPSGRVVNVAVKLNGRDI